MGRVSPSHGKGIRPRLLSIRAAHRLGRIDLTAEPLATGSRARDRIGVVLCPKHHPFAAGSNSAWGRDPLSASGVDPEVDASVVPRVITGVSLDKATCPHNVALYACRRNFTMTGRWQFCFSEESDRASLAGIAVWPEPTRTLASAMFRQPAVNTHSTRRSPILRAQMKRKPRPSLGSWRCDSRPQIGPSPSRQAAQSVSDHSTRVF
jgi:hypothetical protein